MAPLKESKLQTGDESQHAGTRRQTRDKDKKGIRNENKRCGIIETRTRVDGLVLSEKIQ